MALMSSKRAGSNLGKAILYETLNLIVTGKFSEVPNEKLWYLKRRGYLGKDGGSYYLLPKAYRSLSECRIWSLTLPTPAKWDGKWRMVMFDIPHDKQKRRDVFRLRIKELGLVLYQQSVWIYPHPIQETVGQIADFYKLSRCVSFIIAESVTGENKFKRHFNLK